MVETPTPDHPVYISTRAAAARLGVTEPTIRTLLGNGGLIGIRVGRVVRVDEASIVAYRDANAYTGRPQR